MIGGIVSTNRTRLISRLAPIILFEAMSIRCQLNDQHDLGLATAYAHTFTAEEAWTNSGQMTPIHQLSTGWGQVTGSVMPNSPPANQWFRLWHAHRTTPRTPSSPMSLSQTPLCP